MSEKLTLRARLKSFLVRSILGALKDAAKGFIVGYITRQTAWIIIMGFLATVVAFIQNNWLHVLAVTLVFLDLLAHLWPKIKKRDKYIPLLHAILELEKIVGFLEDPANLRFAKDCGSTPDDFLAGLHIWELKKHLIGNKVILNVAALEKTPIPNDDLPHKGSNRTVTGATYGENKWDENYEKLLSPTGKLLYEGVSVERKQFEEIIRKKKERARMLAIN